MRARVILAVAAGIFVLAFAASPKIALPVILFALAYALVQGLWAESKMKSLETTIIEEREGILTQKDASGKMIGTININMSYRITKPYIAYGDTIFRVRQNGQRVEFCTRMPNAEHIAKDVLKMQGEWPPVPKWNYPW